MIDHPNADKWRDYVRCGRLLLTLSGTVFQRLYVFIYRLASSYLKATYVDPRSFFSWDLYYRCPFEWAPWHSDHATRDLDLWIKLISGDEPRSARRPTLGQRSTGRLIWLIYSIANWSNLCLNTNCSQMVESVLRLSLVMFDCRHNSINIHVST